MNVGEDSTGGNRDVAEQLVQLFVILDGQGNMTRDDTGLLVVASSVSSELEDLGAQVLQDSRQIDRGARSHACRVFSHTEVTANTTDGKLQASLGAAASGRLLLAAASLALSLSRCTYGDATYAVSEMKRRSQGRVCQSIRRRNATHRTRRLRLNAIFRTGAMVKRYNKDEMNNLLLPDMMMKFALLDFDLPCK